MQAVADSVWSSLPMLSYASHDGVIKPRGLLLDAAFVTGQPAGTVRTAVVLSFNSPEDFDAVVLHVLCCPLSL